MSNIRQHLLFLSAGKGLVKKNYTMNFVESLCLTEERFDRQTCSKSNETRVSHLNRPERTTLVRTIRYENSCFPYTIKKWKDLNEEVKAKSYVRSFKKHLNDFKHRLGHSLFRICDIFGIKLLTKTRIGFSDLLNHMFHHNFNC